MEEYVEIPEEELVSVTVPVSAGRADRWRAAAVEVGEEDDLPEWAANRLREYGGWRFFTRTVAGEEAVREAARRLCRTMEDLETDRFPGISGWELLAAIMTASHRELAIEVGRMAEMVAGSATRPAAALSTSPSSAPGDPEEWVLIMDAMELDDLAPQAAGWGFRSFPEWISAVIDTMADHDTTPFGIRDTIVETRDAGAAAAPLKGLADAVRAWVGVDGGDGAPTLDRIIEAARFARMVMAVRVDR